MNGKVVNLRFGSVHYYAMVWVNGQFVGEHEGGHLPFDIKNINTNLLFGKKNLLSVAVNNTLTNVSLPQGFIEWKSSENGNYPPGYFTHEYAFDFFNYAGIHRSVVLYTVPASISITDVTVITTDLAKDYSQATLSYEIEYVSEEFDEDPVCFVELQDKKTQERVSSGTGCVGSLTINEPKLWWPYLMNEDYGHLHTMKVWVTSPKNGDDIYRLNHVGIRSVTWNTTSFMINHKEFYFRGFGRHEDSDIRGKGLDLPLIARDFNLIKWIGGNSFRTSHYPYAEEIMDMADEEGIVIVDESPGVSLDHFSDGLLQNHLKVMQEIINRDKNRACVVMWSIANEPRSQREEAEAYFKEVADFTRQADPANRPVTVVLNQDVLADKGQFFFNLYQCQMWIR
jgi:beta-glucuronidase